MGDDLKIEEIGNCVIKKKIGEGEFSIIYFAEHKFTHSPRAVKILFPKWSGKEDIVKRFFLEGKVLEKIIHPNIVRIYEIGKEEINEKVLLYMELEYLPLSLEKIVRKNYAKFPVIPPSQIKNYAIQICDGLSLLHKNNIVHRDIKPANILINEKDEVKIADFGIVKIIGENHYKHTIAGTPGFAAPEQLIDTGKLDWRCDIYGLGATIYYAIFGEEIKREKLNKNYSNFELSDLINIVKKATASDPDDRFSTIEEVKDALIGKKNFIINSRSEKGKTFVEEEKIEKKQEDEKKDIPQSKINPLEKSKKAHLNKISILFVMPFKFIKRNFKKKPEKEPEYIRKFSFKRMGKVLIVFVFFSGVFFLSSQIYKYQKAKRKKIALLNQEFENYFKKGVYYFKRKDYEKAVEFFEKARRIKENMEIDLYLGKIYSIRNMPYESLEFFKKVVSQKPDDIQIRLNLAQTYITLGKFSEAKYELEEILNREPENKEAKALLNNIKKRRK